MGRSLKIYGAHIPSGHPQSQHSVKAGRSQSKSSSIHQAHKANHKHTKHKKGGPTQTWEQAMKGAGLSL